MLGLLLPSIGWVAGWLLLARWRVVGAVPGPPRTRRPLAVVIPARDEAANIGPLLAGLLPQLGPDDECVVVDDGSTDGTAERAAVAGATVVRPRPLPDGWAGKPWACAAGAAATSNEVLVFVDADVRLAPGVLDALDEMSRTAPAGTLVSVQPHHVVHGVLERAALFPNLVALMGCGAFLPWRRGRADAAFGPVLVTTRADYLASGGHAHPTVRASVIEDVALGRRYRRVQVVGGGRHAVTFRMYPGGRGLVEGFTKNLSAGASGIRRWIAVAVALWVTALAGGPFAHWAWYVAGAAQVWVLGRRVGRYGPLTALLYPLALAAFVVLVVRSVLLARGRRAVRWRGRTIRT